VTGPEEFYDALAAEYHLLFPDWWAAAQWHGEVISHVLADRGVRPPARLLDCTCGVGTQALPLAARGHRTTGTDLSRRAIGRARREAEVRDITVTLCRADVREVRAAVTGTFDAVISCDNSLPHLLTDEDLLLAARNTPDKLRPGGLFLGSIRDYDRALSERPNATVPSVVDEPEGRRIYFQAWDWADDGRTYTVHLFLVGESDGAWETHHHETRYRAVLRDELTEILREAGFREVAWLVPEESGYYQPIVTARRD